MRLCLKEIDTVIFYFINQKMANTLLDFVMSLFVRYEDWLLVSGVVIALMLYSDHRKCLLTLIICLLTVALNDSFIHLFLKPLFGRPRPCNVLPPDTVRLLVGCGESFSFPSQHAANIFVVLSIIGSKYKGSYPLLSIIALMVAFSRVYLGVHFPVDVLGGAIIGIGWGGCALYIEQRLTQLRNITASHKKREP